MPTNQLNTKGQTQYSLQERISILSKIPYVCQSGSGFILLPIDSSSLEPQPLIIFSLLASLSDAQFLELNTLLERASTEITLLDKAHALHQEAQALDNDLEFLNKEKIRIESLWNYIKERTPTEDYPAAPHNIPNPKHEAIAAFIGSIGYDDTWDTSDPLELEIFMTTKKFIELAKDNLYKIIINHKQQ